MPYLAFKDINPCYSTQVPFRYDGDLFDLRRLKSKTKVFAKHIRGVQYADDIVTFTAYSNLSLKMGLRINIKKNINHECC